MNQIPVEILFKIITYFSGTDYIKFILTCKKFNKLLPTIKFDSTIIDFDSDLLECLTCFNRLDIIKILPFDHEPLYDAIAISDNCEMLKYWNIIPTKILLYNILYMDSINLFIELRMYYNRSMLRSAYLNDSTKIIKYLDKNF